MALDIAQIFSGWVGCIWNNNYFNNNHNNAVSLNDLREDCIIESSQIEKEIIIENFPKEKNGYLVVSKVIEE